MGAATLKELQEGLLAGAGGCTWARVLRVLDQERT